MTKKTNSGQDLTQNSDGLTLKQRLFAEKWIQFRCNRTAAIAAGYKNGPGIDASASALLRNPKVSAFINQRMNKLFEKESNKGDDITSKLLQIAYSRITDYMDFDAASQTLKIRSLNDLPDTLKSAIESIKITDKGSVEIKLRNAVEALKELAKIYKLYEPGKEDQQDIKGHVFFIGGFHQHNNDE